MLWCWMDMQDLGSSGIYSCVAKMVPGDMSIPSPAVLGNRGGALPSFLDRISTFTAKGSNVLAVVAQILEGALQSLPNILANTGAVLVSAIASVVAVSFFRGETTLFTTPSQLIIFVTGTLNPILGILGGIAIVLKAQRKGEFDQRELAVLFTLVLFAISYYYGLVRIPEFTLAS